jgi:hypothetical protein
MVTILYRIEPFLGNDRETNNGPTPFARQQILNNATVGL